MALPTINDVLISNPVLTNMLIGYMQADSRFAALRTFPTVTVDHDSGSYPIFSKKYWFSDGLQARAPETRAAQGGWGIESASYATKQWALEKLIGDEIRANSQVPLDLETATVRWLSGQSLIRKERGFAADFMIAGVWGTDVAGTTDFVKWSTYASSDPFNDIRLAVRTVSQNTGMEANTAVTGSIVEDKLMNHPDLIDRMKHVTQATAANLSSALSAVLGVNLIVSKATYNSANTGQAASMGFIIDDDMLVCYVDPSNDVMTATAGKTFIWEPGGGQGSIDTYRDEPAKSDVVREMEQWDQKATATDCGYFLADVVD